MHTVYATIPSCTLAYTKSVRRRCTMNLPNTYTSKNETGCCAVPNINEWQNKQLEFTNQRFIRMHTKSFLFVPLNIAKIMKRLDASARAANATMAPENAIILSRDISPWKAEQYYGVTKPVEGQDNVVLNGTYLSKVFEGPYKDARKWYQAMQEYATQKDKRIKKLYFFYTTCPKCAKHYGKNYTIGLAEV